MRTTKAGVLNAYIIKQERGRNKMATLKEEAQAYEPPQTANIADLEQVPVDIEVFDGEGKNKEGEVFKYKYTEIGGHKYRIAGIVLGGIKAILEKMPDVKEISVMKFWKGLNTQYQVVPVIPAKPKEEQVKDSVVV